MQQPLIGFQFWLQIRNRQFFLHKICQLWMILRNFIAVFLEKNKKINLCTFCSTLYIRVIFFGKTAWTAGASKPSLYLSAIVVQGKTLILSVIQDYYCAILCESMSVSQLNEWHAITVTSVYWQRSSSIRLQ